MVVVFALLALVLVTVSIAAAFALRARIGRSPELDVLRTSTAGLSWPERWRVYRAVTRGRAVTEPALAAAAVARARYVRSYGQRVTRGRWRWAVPALAALQFLLAALRVALSDDTGPTRWLGAGSSALLGVLLLSIPLQWRLYVRRADRAEQLNLRLLQQESHL